MKGPRGEACNIGISLMGYNILPVVLLSNSALECVKESPWCSQRLCPCVSALLRYTAVMLAFMLAYTRIFFSSTTVNCSNSSQVLVEVLSVKFLVKHKNTWAINASVSKSEIWYPNPKSGRVCQSPSPAYKAFSNQAKQRSPPPM